MNHQKPPIVGFAGMTHLGLNSAVATAERGFQVVCFDENSNHIQQLKEQALSITEPQLPELIAKNINKMTFTDCKVELSNCDIIYIAADVPTDDQGHSDLSPIQKLIEEVLSCINNEAILVILCQVPPGFTRQLPLEKHRLFYQVETLIFGQAMERALHPERIIVGCSTPEKPLPPLYHALLQTFQCPILPMRYESAELAKISINCCLVASISVANTLSELCEQIGADWSEIVPALKLDKRIGQHSYLNPGLGIAGGNLERDLSTVLQLAAQHGTNAKVVEAWVNNSRYRKEWALKIFHQTLGDKLNPVIAIWGLSYKENTHSIKNSPSIALIQSLKSYSVKVFDPVVPATTGVSTRLSATMSPQIQGCSSPLEAATHADVLIIMTPWAEFREIDIKQLVGCMKGRVIIDPFRVLSGKASRKAGFEYHTLGSKILEDTLTL